MRLTKPLLAIVLCIGAAVALRAEDKDTGWVKLLEGGDLTKHFTTKGNWNIDKDGVVELKPRKGETGWQRYDAYLWAKQEYTNFEADFEYKVAKGGNSGVALRTPDKGDPAYAGMEIQLLDDNHPSYAKLDFYQYTGSIYHVVPPTRRAGKPAGQWNALEVRADGRRIVVVLNGIKIVDADLDRCLLDAAVAKEHTGLKRTTGHIGLQSHTDRVEFRNLRIKTLQ